MKLSLTRKVEKLIATIVISVAIIFSFIFHNLYVQAQNPPNGSNIPGYTYGNPNLKNSPVTLADLRLSRFWMFGMALSVLILSCLITLPIKAMASPTLNI
jgi:hypothetical protein